MKKTTENSLVNPILTILALNGPLFASDLSSELQKIVHLFPHDKEMLDNRNTSHFEQIVYNIISHRKLNKILKSKELVSYSRVNGMRKFILSITPAGVSYLKKSNRS